MTMRTMADFERTIRALDITVVQVNILGNGRARLVRVADDD